MMLASLNVTHYTITTLDPEEPNSFQEFLNSRVNYGSTVDRILLTEFPSYPLLWHGKSLVDRFESIFSVYWQLIHNNQKQNQELTSIRDTLLPKLLSGIIRANEIEKILEVTI